MRRKRRFNRRAGIKKGEVGTETRTQRVKIKNYPVFGELSFPIAMTTVRVRHSAERAAEKEFPCESP